ncbi:hypothetical protein TNIN_268271 [Trichonephila inaurata madagascariensis]|uniref:Uncharacterized protein n=1 Tax=Trichonephila inaurata madagascariensis TaxID=2747483 RepID=A0A8X6XG34_9ARAC|nr:hypothetical protein TNIN_268271 [Trichonephila inaurata madagascariensis]
MAHENRERFRKLTVKDKRTTRNDRYFIHIIMVDHTVSFRQLTKLRGTFIGITPCLMQQFFAYYGIENCVQKFLRTEFKAYVKASILAVIKRFRSFQQKNQYIR